eukprot:3916854-Karenia_brevis.AAC.1
MTAISTQVHKRQEALVCQCLLSPQGEDQHSGEDIIAGKKRGGGRGGRGGGKGRRGRGNHWDNWDSNTDYRSWEEPQDTSDQIIPK